MIDNQKDVSPVADSTLHFHGEIIKIKVFLEYMYYSPRSKYLKRVLTIID